MSFGLHGSHFIGRCAALTVCQNTDALLPLLGQVSLRSVLNSFLYLIRTRFFQCTYCSGSCLLGCWLPARRLCQCRVDGSAGCGHYIGQQRHRGNHFPCLLRALQQVSSQAIASSWRNLYVPLFSSSAEMSSLRGHQAQAELVSLAR